MLFCILLGVVAFTVQQAIHKYHKNESLSIFVNPYGLNYNLVRRSLQIPIIEPNWGIHEVYSFYIWWSKPGLTVDRAEPFHFYKITHLRSGSISHEEDAFHFETNGDTAFRLTIINFLENDTVNNSQYELMTYHKTKYDQKNKARFINKQKADSILRKWLE